MAERLAKARSQLAQVESLLKDDPTDADLLLLVDDLRKAVCTAEALVGVVDNGPSSSGWKTTAPSSSQNNGKAFAPSVAVEDGPDFLPGQRCEVKSKECKRWQAAVVLKRLPDFEFEAQRLFDSKELLVKGVNEIREIGHASLRHDALIPGLKVRARYASDGKYYQAVVDRRTEHGCTVRFEGYEDDDPEQVALEHVRISEVGEPPSLLAPIEIPKNLVINADDSDEVKDKKRRQQKALRRRARDEIIDQVHSQKQGSWLAFQATNKRVKGALTSVGGASQFSAAYNNKS